MPDQDERYRQVNVDENSVVIYDKYNEAAWVQSDYHIKVGSKDLRP